MYVKIRCRMVKFMDDRQKQTQYRGHGSDDPEGLKQLWMAVAIQAAKDLSNPLYEPGARHWFLSDTVRVGSFQWICDHTGLNEAVIRRAVREGKYEGQES